MGRDCRRRGARVVLAAAIFLAIAPVPAAGALPAKSSDEPALPSIPTIDPASPSLSPGGRAFLEQAALTDAPRYALSVTIDPETGGVDGRMRAQVPRSEAGSVRFRMLAGLPALRTGLSVKSVTVDGKKAHAERDQALLTVPVARSGAEKMVVGMRFSYRVPRAGTTNGRPLTQATIALLSRGIAFSQYGPLVPGLVATRRRRGSCAFRVRRHRQLRGRRHHRPRARAHGIRRRERGRHHRSARVGREDDRDRVGGRSP